MRDGPGLAALFPSSHWLWLLSWTTGAVVQLLSHVDSVTPWTAAHQASLPSTISWSLLRLMSIELMMPSNHLILCLSTFSTFSSRPQPFPASGSFSMNWFFASGGQSIGASASASVLPVNIQGCLPLGLTGLIFLLSQGLNRGRSAINLLNRPLRKSLFSV